MTVTEFLAWDSGDRSGASWQLRDGEPEMMAPASDAHGSIQNELARLITNHLADRNSPCRAVTAPGVIPRVRASENYLIPDIGITCTPPRGATAMPDPVVLVEILSPSNQRETRANVWAYATIPSVMEILLLRSAVVGAELLRRRPDGSWPEQAEQIGSDGDIVLESIGFRAPLRAAYRTSGVA